MIDAVLYVMGSLGDQGRGIRALRPARRSAAPEEAHRVIAAALAPMVAATLGSAAYESIRQKLVRLPEPPTYPRLRRTEWLGALTVFLWVFLTTFPVALPFIFVDEVTRAMRLSNANAIALLFLTGFAFGRVTEYGPWMTGMVMVILGGLLVALTMALGG